MPIDPDKLRGAVLSGGTARWTQEDIIMYHLGLGAGVAATDPRELEYVYEGNLKVLPTFGVIPLFDVLSAVQGLDGVDFDLAMLLHGEQDLRLHGPIPTEATVDSTGSVVGVYDKGKAALLVIETETLGASGEPMFTNRFSMFIRGEGGFGGEAGPKAGNDPPSREPDVVLTSPTLPQQALIYRLSGDMNPLHADPEFARLGGFDRPILHGLCTYGVVCKAVVDNMLDGDVNRVGRFQVRFAGVVFPGETIVTSVWRERNRLLLQAGVRERDTAVITNAAITLV